MYYFPDPFPNKKKKVMTHNISMSRYLIVLFLFWSPIEKHRLLNFIQKLFKCANVLKSFKLKISWAPLFSESLSWTTLKILQAEFQFEIRTFESHNVLKSCRKLISKWPLILPFSAVTFVMNITTHNHAGQMTYDRHAARAWSIKLLVLPYSYWLLSRDAHIWTDFAHG